MVSAPNGVTLQYDPLGRLLKTVSGSTVTRYAYDGITLIAEYQGGAMLRRYVHGPGSDEPIVWYEGATTSDRRFLMRDERGSIVSVANASGTTLAINSYDEYGIPASGNLGRFGYTGQTWLPEIGMYYYKARLYSPTLGRFMQSDPIGYADGMNMYAYVGGDPINYVDPTGLADIPTTQIGQSCIVTTWIRIIHTEDGKVLKIFDKWGSETCFPLYGITGDGSGQVRGGGGGGGATAAAAAAAAAEEYCRNLREASERTAGDLPFFGSPGTHGYGDINSLQGMLRTHQGYADEDAVIGTGSVFGGGASIAGEVFSVRGALRLGSRALGWVSAGLGAIGHFNGIRQQTIINALEARIAHLRAQNAGVCP